MLKSTLGFVAIAGLFATSLAFGAGPIGGGGNHPCIQVIVWAVNPQTGECREFPNPCAVPAGWTVYHQDVCNVR